MSQDTNQKYRETFLFAKDTDSSNEKTPNDDFIHNSGRSAVAPSLDSFLADIMMFKKQLLSVFFRPAQILFVFYLLR